MLGNMKSHNNPHADCAVKRLVVMGGNEAYNDWTSTGAEFNFYCDPDAAETVLSQVSDCHYAQATHTPDINIAHTSLPKVHAMHILCWVQPATKHCKHCKQCGSNVNAIWQKPLSARVLCIQAQVLVYVGHTNTLKCIDASHLLTPVAVCWQDHTADVGVHATQPAAPGPGRSCGAQGSQQWCLTTLCIEPEAWYMAEV